MELFSIRIQRTFQLVSTLQEEGTENGSGHNQEDAGEEPARRSLGRIGIAAAELAIRLDTADQTEYGSNGITQFGGRIEIRSHKAGSLIDAGKTLSLCEGTCRCQHTQY